MPALAGMHYFVHLAEETTPSRPPVILIHGAGGSYLTWHPYIRRLKDETVYALDLPGHGQSEGDGRQSIDEYADDVIRFMDAANIQAAVLAGISMGSAIALTLALSHPHRVAGLVLIGGGGKMRVAPSILEGVENPGTFASTVETINANFFSNASHGLIRLSKQGLLKTDPSVLFGDFLACDQFDVTDRLAEIKIPALILCGEHDRMMPPKFSHSLRDALPNAQLFMIENAGHMAQLEQPDVVAEAIKQFLDDLPLLSAP
ncbi:MAG: alpha/beta fold hydrolase [Anaerolineales bacterium]|nr:alpha/beta fold hydrolase [Anaerolineales bacterium]